MQDIMLTLFFTYQISLKEWYEKGLIYREIALYQRLTEKGVSVQFITHGDTSDNEYQYLIPNIKILPNRFGLSPRWYGRLIPIVHAPHLAKSTILKTNQSLGGYSAIRSAKLWRKPLIARSGYSYAQFIKNQFEPTHPQVKIALNLEQNLFSTAQHIIVTTAQMKQDILTNYTEPENKITIVPNYVDETVFSPKHVREDDKDIDILFVGRLTEQKNVRQLLEATAKHGYRVCIIGSGELKQDLQIAFEQYTNITWINNVPNNELPEFMKRAKLFVLPSLYEGHPKALLEAMCAGMAVLGTDVAGIHNVIEHDVNGWLCDTSSESINQATKQLIDNPDLREKLGSNARQYALQTVALSKIAQLEYDLLTQIVARSTHIAKDTR